MSAHETESAVLVGDEVRMARTAVRKYLAKMRNNYRNDLRRDSTARYAPAKLTRFDAYLDLYAVLGGDIDDVLDPEDS